MPVKTALLRRFEDLPRDACVVGAAEATTKLRDGELVTVDATPGAVYEGEIAVSAPERVAGDGAASIGGEAPVTATQLLVKGRVLLDAARKEG